MVKLIGFKYGSWIYIIHAEENKYDWSDDFWNKIEVVRKGISFE